MNERKKGSRIVVVSETRSKDRADVILFCGISLACLAAILTASGL